LSTKAVISLTTGLEDPGHAAGRHTGPARRRLMIRTTDMVEVARRFDVSDDDTLVMRQDYLEAVIHKPATR
jgi:hypothetical protein